MNVQINENFIVKIDKYNYALYERIFTETKEGKLVEYEVNRGYFSKMEHALKKVTLILEEKDKSTVGIEGYLEKVQDFSYKIQRDIEKISRELIL